MWFNIIMIYINAVDINIETSISKYKRIKYIKSDMDKIKKLYLFHTLLSIKNNEEIEIVLSKDSDKYTLIYIKTKNYKYYRFETDQYTVFVDDKMHIIPNNMLTESSLFEMHPNHKNLVTDKLTIASKTYIPKKFKQNHKIFSVIDIKKNSLIRGKSQMSCPYGPRRLKGRRGHHSGVDYSAKVGSPILNPCDGIVVAIYFHPYRTRNPLSYTIEFENSSFYFDVNKPFAWIHPSLAKGLGKDVLLSFKRRISGYGNIVIIQHDKSYYSFYAHLNQPLCAPGQIVRANTIIGIVGTTGISTGPHLHFEIRYKKGDLNILTHKQDQNPSQTFYVHKYGLDKIHIPKFLEYKDELDNLIKDLPITEVKDLSVEGL